MNIINKLESLYYGGNISECITLGEKYLVEFPENKELLTLLAICYQQKIVKKRAQDKYTITQQYIIPYLTRVLNIDPNDEIALFLILQNTLENQNNSKQQHITKSNTDQYINYCYRLIEHKEKTIIAYSYLIQIFELNNQIKEALTTINTAFDFTNTYYSNNRELRDINNTQLLIKKINILFNEKIKDRNIIEECIEKHIKTFISTNENDYFYIADVCKKIDNNTLATRLLLKLIDNELYQNTNNLIEWYYTIEDFIDKGNSNLYVMTYKLLIEKYHYKELNKTAEHYYTEALKLINNKAYDYLANYFVGNYLFEQANHEECKKYLELAIRIKVDSKSWSRLYFLKLKENNNTSPTIPNFFDDSPNNVLNNIIWLTKQVSTLELKNNQVQIALLTEKLYENCFLGFLNYFENNKTESTLLASLHNWSICCNNYALSKIEVNKHVEAIELVKKGFEMSELEELHQTLVFAYLKNNNLIKAKETLELYFSKYSYEISDIYIFSQLKLTEIKINQLLKLSQDINLETEKLLKNVQKNISKNIYDLESL